MKVLITGASGLLGRKCRTTFEQEGHEVVALCRKLAWDVVNTRETKVLAGFDVMIHAAANTNVEKCELDPDACYRDNFLLTEGLTIACARLKIPLVFISSTGVYGETQDTPYREYSAVHPTTHHHQAKRMSEKVVLSASVANLIVRTGWLFGGSFESPRNFVARRIEEANKAAKAGVGILSNNEQRGCPTYNGDLANRILLLIREGCSGIFNVVNEGNASRLEYVRAILDSAGSSVDIEPAGASAFNRQAKVSSNEMAVNWRSNELGLPQMPCWRKSLDRYIREQSKEN